MHTRKLFFLLTLPFMLSGCDTIRSTLGLDHNQANGFDVPINPPLVLPPDFNLRPPKPGAPPTYAHVSGVEAQKALKTYDAQIASDKRSEAEFVGQLQKAPPVDNIRDIVNKEAEQEGNLSGRLGQQVDKWKSEAKANFYSINGDKKDVPSPEESQEAISEASLATSEKSNSE